MPLLLLLFIVSIFVPVEFFINLGGFRLEFYRIVLIMALLYSIVHYRELFARANAIDLALWALVGFSLMSYTYNHGVAKAIESSGIFAIEVLGAYYLAKFTIRGAPEYFKANHLFLAILAVVVVFSLYEAVAKHRILHDIAKSITGNEGLDYRLYSHHYIRMGLLRTTNLFAHPILYGTIGALFFPFAILLFLRHFSVKNGLMLSGLFIGMLSTFSSAPLLSIVLQMFAGGVSRLWYGARRFWISMALFMTSAMLLISMFSNRGIAGLLIAHFTFNPATGYYRLLQWQYSMDDIADNPIFGLGIIAPGYNDWTYPEWMVNSIDSYWLLLTLQYGVFATMVLFVACVYTLIRVMNRVHLFEPGQRWLVQSWVMAFFALIMIGLTVDYFGKIQPLFFFLMGASAWMLEENKHQAGRLTNDQQKEA